LLALMLLHDARRSARLDEAGALVLLEDQDRTLWDAERIGEGRRMLDRALPYRKPGPYQLQAAIASLHLEPETDWPQVAALYARACQRRRTSAAGACAAGARSRTRPGSPESTRHSARCSRMQAPRSRSPSLPPRGTPMRSTPTTRRSSGTTARCCSIRERS